MPIRQLFAEFRVPLQQTLELIRPHLPKIQSAWRRKLLSLGFKREALNLLSLLMPQAHFEHLEIQNYESYRSELERQGKNLERSGVTEAQIAAAYSFYLESCLPYVGATRGRKEPVAALVRLFALSQYLTLSSYAAEWTANLRKLQERERHSLSRDLHDDIGHNLLVLKLYLEMMSTDLNRGDITQVQSKLDEALALVSYALDSVRRLMLDLGPAMLAQFGFLPALRIYSRQFTLRTGVQVKLEEANLPPSIPSSYETAIYRVLQGALSNVVQHSHAKQVKVTIGSVTNSVLFMSIEDDG